MQANVLVKRFLIVLLMGMMLVIVLGVGTPAVHAQSLKSQLNRVPASVTPCTPLVNGSLHIFCKAPQVSITCGGAIGSTTDLNGVPINWTFNTQQPGRVCVTVAYTNLGIGAGGGCEVWFYIPKGDATGDIFFHFSNGITVVLNENPVDGWFELVDKINNVDQLTFTDVNDQPTNSVQLGWGSTSSFSLKLICAF